MNEKVPQVSVVVPLLNERENIEPLLQEITQSLSERYDYEIIFVDDGSDDGSFELLGELHRSDARIRVIQFRRNFGQTAALSAGFDHARGKIVIAIDADLQNDPADIPRMIEKLEDILHRERMVELQKEIDELPDLYGEINEGINKECEYLSSPDLLVGNPLFRKPMNKTVWGDKYIKPLSQLQIYASERDNLNTISNGYIIWAGLRVAFFIILLWYISAPY